MIDKVKEIDIKEVIETETNSKLDKYNILNECPFCGSGKGSNKSPAFSINKKDNYFKCFSCGVKGTTIDFMINLKKGWKESNAIKHLKENYLHITNDPLNNLPVLDKFQKTIYAITNNPIQTATEYLSKRNINTKALPKGSYYYDSLSKSVVFFDSESKLINRRIINPVNGSPKAKNQGKLTGSIYDKLFNPESDTVYIFEGVINVLSMPNYSSIAIFSTENKIADRKKLHKYFDGKHVVIAFDNDNAGNKCFDYYKTFLLSNRFDIKSVRKLVFPEKKDANDLLCSGELDKFMKNKNNYELIWEDILSKPIPGDSKNKTKDNDEFFFYKDDSCYYSKEYIKGKPVIKKLSNFLMEILYHLIDGTKDSRRIIKFQRNTGEIVVMELYSSELNLEKFKKIIRSISGKGLSFFGFTSQLEHILAFLQDHEQRAEAITQLGYQKEYKIYCFADAIITENNQLLFPDKLGIVNSVNQSYYLAPFSYTNIKNESYNGQRKFTYKEGILDFKDWSELIYKAYGINGAIGIIFLVLALFRDYILSLTGFFPFLFLFGDQGAGKSNYINFFLHLFGEPNNGISLLNSTDKGFSRSLTQRTNALYYLKEYTNAIDKKTVDVFKTGYDGELYTMAQKSNDNKTITLEITSACMVDGNELPTSEAALFARMIVLNFEDNKFSKESTVAYKTLLENRDKGFCQVTRELLKYRPFIEEKFKKVFDDTFYDVKSSLTKEKEISDRQLRHIALLLAPVKLLQDKLDFPFQYDDYANAVIENAKSQDELSNEIKDVTVFWTAIAFKINETYSDIKENIHYQKDPVKEIIFIKLKPLYPYYVDYAKKNNMKVMDFHSLKELLTSKGNKSFIANSTQQTRSSKAYTKKNFGSCYMFRYETAEDQTGIIINGVELNL